MGRAGSLIIVLALLAVSCTGLLPAPTPTREPTVLPRGGMTVNLIMPGGVAAEELDAMVEAVPAAWTDLLLTEPRYELELLATTSHLPDCEYQYGRVLTRTIIDVAAAVTDLDSGERLMQEVFHGSLPCPLATARSGDLLAVPDEDAFHDWLLAQMSGRPGLRETAG